MTLFYLHPQNFIPPSVQTHDNNKYKTFVGLKWEKKWTTEQHEDINSLLGLPVSSWLSLSLLRKKISKTTLCAARDH